MKEHEERMAFRLPAAEAEQIRASAQALGVSVSEWLRIVIRQSRIIVPAKDIARRKAAGLDE